MVPPVVNYADNITKVSFDFAILENRKLDLCMVQAGPPSIEAVKSDGARSNSVRLIEQLLTASAARAQPFLTELLPRSRMTVILMPEFAFGFQDWAELDSSVRASEQPVILIAGFGATRGSELISWANNAENTVRHLAWNAPISSRKIVNGGWCWVHQPGARTDCFTWMKNVAEQSFEAVEFPDMQFGREGLHLAFQDISIFPVICADLLASFSVNGSTQDKIKREIAADNRPTIPVLITGSLWQPGYNRNWEMAIGDILQHVAGDRPTALALCNIAHDHPENIESSDKWRSMSGVFVKFQDLPRCQKNLHAGRSLETATISGVVVRDSKPCIVVGKLAWRPFSPVEGQFLWHSDILCHINSGGIDLENSANNTSIRCEVERSLRRFPSRSGWDPRVGEGLNDLRARVVVSSERLLTKIVASILKGIEVKGNIEPDILHEMTDFLDGIYAVAVLKTLERTSWLDDERQEGHLVSNDVGNVLVWNDRERTSSAIRRKIEEWLSNPLAHPNLLIFGSSVDSASEGEVFVTSRSDITIPLTELRGVGGNFFNDSTSITEYKLVRRAAIFSIEKVADVYKDYSPGEATARISSLQRVIDNAFSRSA